MNHPTGRECNEGDCQWLAPKRGVPAATSDRKPTDYEYIGKPSYWPECPRAIRAERDALRAELERLATKVKDLRDQYEGSRITADGYRHEAIALRAIIEQLTEPCPDCATIPQTPGTVNATCGTPGCYAGRVNRLAKAGDALAEAGAEFDKLHQHEFNIVTAQWSIALNVWRAARGQS